MKFQAQLKSWRTKHKLTLAQAAARLGVKNPTLCNWLYGRNKPSLFVVQAVVKKMKGRK